MADSNKSHQKTRFPCPFYEDSSTGVWEPFWRRPGSCNIKMLHPDQQTMLCEYFKEAALLQNQGHPAKTSYRFPMVDLGNYFGMSAPGLRHHIINSTIYKQYLTSSTTGISLSPSTNGLSSSTDYSPAIPVTADETDDVEVDGTPPDGCAAEPDSWAEQDRLSPTQTRPLGRRVRWAGCVNWGGRGGDRRRK